MTGHYAHSIDDVCDNLYFGLNCEVSDDVGDVCDNTLRMH